jgi:DMSO/TMAO reductase YedYZ molybdopterin-dependent catalytic subunit
MADSRSSDSMFLRVEGGVVQSLRLGFDDLRALPEDARVIDVSRFHPSRRGDGVALDAILRVARPFPGATRAILHADRDDFHLGLPLAALRERAIVVYCLDGEALPARLGGPFRMLILDAAGCLADELDECANVKYLSRIEIA